MKNLEQMCRDHFNEPILTDTIGRLIGYGEDDYDCYLIIHYPNYEKEEIIWHTCVGGYFFLDRFKGQEVVYDPETGEKKWDDFDRLDLQLTHNNVPKRDEFLLEFEYTIPEGSNDDHDDET